MPDVSFVQVNFSCTSIKTSVERKKKAEIALLLLHVSKRMTNNNTAQCLAVVLSPAHICGILVQTCGHSLRKPWVIALCRRVHGDVRQQCVRACSDLSVLISLGAFLYATPHYEIRALCHIRWSDSASVLPVKITIYQGSRLVKMCGHETQKGKREIGNSTKVPSISCLAQAWLHVASLQSWWVRILFVTEWEAHLLVK